MPSATTLIMATFPDMTADRNKETPVRRRAQRPTTPNIRPCSTWTGGVLPAVSYHLPTGFPSGKFAACQPRVSEYFLAMGREREG